MKKFRRHLSFANTTSMVALFVALGGVSYAAIVLPANSVGSKQIKRNAVSSAKVKNGTLLAADFRAGQLPAGAQGPAGPAGPKGDQGQQGTQGQQGIQGIPGEDGEDFTATSPMKSGETQVGPWVTSGGDSTSGFASTTFTFRPVLPANFVMNTDHWEYVPTPPETGCPGIGQADPGFFCVYQTSNQNQNENALSITNVGGGMLYMNITGASSYAAGSWAVTAP